MFAVFSNVGLNYSLLKKGAFNERGVSNVQSEVIKLSEL